MHSKIQRRKGNINKAKVLEPVSVRKSDPKDGHETCHYKSKGLSSL